MEDCTPFIDDDTATASSISVSSSWSCEDDTSASSGHKKLQRMAGDVETESDNDDLTVSSPRRGDHFRVMDLPVEVRAKILNMQNQRAIPSLRLVCRQWKEEIDQFYEFALNIYDTTTNLNVIRNLRCRECTIWKLTDKLEPINLFSHPGYLKVLKVYGPTSAENLQNLIQVSTNLEHITLTRRANYPWFFNLKETPSLNNLLQLKYLRLNSEEHIIISSNPSLRKDILQFKVPPMMDCFFPKLKHFEILKRFAIWQYSHYVTCILQFVARHASTLSTIELDLIPLSCVAFLDDKDHDDSDSSEEDEDDVRGAERRRRRSPYRNRKDSLGISPNEIQLNELCRLRLRKFCVTTKGSDRDIFIWKSILEKQTELRELRFDWLCRDPRTEIRARVTGFPWIHFQYPVEQCSANLVHVELASLSMFAKDFPTSPRNISSRVIPFDLGIFRNCRRLKSLILRCRENHAKLEPNELAQLDPENNPEEGNNNALLVLVAGAMGIPQGEGNNAAGGVGSEEVLLMINGAELPDSIEQLEIFRFPMLTSDLEPMVSRLVNIKKLFLHECGKSAEFGVSCGVIRRMAHLTNLKFLEVIGFNSSTQERKLELRAVFEAIGIPYEGQDTWLEFSDGSSSAHESLKVLL